MSILIWLIAILAIAFRSIGLAAIVSALAIARLLVLIVGFWSIVPLPGGTTSVTTGRPGWGAVTVELIGGSRRLPIIGGVL